MKLECEALAATHNLTQFINFPYRIPDKVDHNPHTQGFFLTDLPYSYKIILTADRVLKAYLDKNPTAPSSCLSLKSSKVGVYYWLVSITDRDRLSYIYSAFP